jgi:hypothetical protein
MVQLRVNNTTEILTSIARTNGEYRSEQSLFVVIRNILFHFRWKNDFFVRNKIIVNDMC